MEKVRSGFRNVKCIATSVSKSNIAHMTEPAFSRLPEDDEWVNIMIFAELENVVCIRIGVGQVSKGLWEDGANTESRRSIWCKESTCFFDDLLKWQNFTPLKSTSIKHDT